MEAKTIPLFTANLSRTQIESGVPFEVTDKDWLLSISDAAAMAPVFKDKWDNVFTFFFDDEEVETWPGIITTDTANHVASVIKAAKSCNKNLWVHCNAGMCRSGAIVEVLSLLGFQIVEDFRAAERVPNTLVFKLVRQQFPELRYSWENQ